MTNDAWGLGFSYDGFGNLLQQTNLKGGAPSFSVTADPATNRISAAGYSYDANGNMTQAPGGATYSYDVANRLVSNGAVYTPNGKRIYDGTYLYFYDPLGCAFGQYTVNWGIHSTAVIASVNLYFDGVPIHLGGHGGWVVTDRLGSVRANANSQRLNYYPYGSEIGTETAANEIWNIFP